MPFFVLECCADSELLEDAREGMREMLLLDDALAKRDRQDVLAASSAVVGG